MFAPIGTKLAYMPYGLISGKFINGSSEPEIKWKEVAITARRTAL
jgi:hypothetical protein